MKAQRQLILTALHFLLVSALSAAGIVSFWIWSRFTVDDAFISWRYGKNLVLHGLWAYNPDSFDLTQAYTNPIFAVLSVIPNALRLDVVAFFKLFAVVTLVSFCFWFQKKAPKTIMLLLAFLALPSTVIHIFSGLETFVFISLITILIISTFERQFVGSLISTVVLFLVRPECWILAWLIPFYYVSDSTTDLKNNRLSALIALIFFSSVLLSIFLISKDYFSDWLPNTFYVKFTNSHTLVTDKLNKFFILNLYIIPIFILIFFNRIKLLILWLTFFEALAFVYSSSELQQNYFGRFEYHIFAPIFLFCCYLSEKFSSEHSKNFLIQKSIFAKVKTVLTLIPVSSILFFILLVVGIRINWIQSFIPGEAHNLVQTETIYPRMLDAHNELGKVLAKIAEKYQIRAFSYGDAGIVAYESNIPALDNLGLASKAVAKTGLTEGLIQQYNIDLMIFHSNLISIGDYFNQTPLVDYARKNGFIEICKGVLFPGYILTIYGRAQFPEILSFCKDSAGANNMNSYDYFEQNVRVAPWMFWRE